MLVLGALLPLVVAIVLGYGLRRWDVVDDAGGQVLNRLAYLVLLPVLLVDTIGSSEPDWAATGGLILLLTLVTVAGALLAWVVALLVRLPRDRIGVVIQAVFRGNLAFIGLPVILLGFADRPDSARLGAQAALALGPVVILYNLLAVAALTWYGGQRRLSVTSFSAGMLRNPLVLASAVGVLLAVSDWRPPDPVQRCLSLLAGAALPVALLGLGVGMHRALQVGGRGDWTAAVVAALGKVLVLPLLGLAVAWVVGSDPTTQRVALVFLATPTAVASYVLVTQLGGDQAFAGRVVCVSTLLAGASLALALVVPL